MLNMRNQSGGGRAVYTTRDWGKTWQEHSSNIKALQEPICMGSLISVAAKDNVLSRNILLFANPNDPKERKNITIKLILTTERRGKARIKCCLMMAMAGGIAALR